MDQRKDRVNAGSPEKLEKEVGDVRNRLTQVVRELDLRRHELTDWRLQAKKHRRPLIAVSAVALVWMGFAVWRRRRQVGPLVRAARTYFALKQIAQDSRALRRESLPHKVALAAGSGVSEMLAKRWVERALQAQK